METEKKRKRTFVQSLNNAAEGFIHVVKHERNMRIHFLAAFFTLILAVFLGVSRVEWMILCLSICFVLTAEMVNTVIEDVVDSIHQSFHPSARIIKDIAAGMVLVSVLNALLVGFFIFPRYWGWPFQMVAFHLRYGAWYLTLTTLLLVVFLVIFGKTFIRRGTPFRGGAVSGHAAIAFSLWTVVLFTQTNNFAVGVTFLLAILVAQSRLRAKIHSFWEVVAGAVVGTLVTSVVFQIFR